MFIKKISTTLVSTSLALFIGASATLAEKFEVQIHGEITYLDTRSEKAKSKFEAGTPFTYTIQFDTSDYIFKEEASKTDRSSVTSLKADVGGYKFSGQSAELTIRENQYGGDSFSLSSRTPEIYKSMGLDPLPDLTQTDGAIEGLTLQQVHLSFDGTSMDLVRPNETLRQVLERLSENFGDTDETEFSMSFANPAKPNDFFNGIFALGEVHRVAVVGDANAPASLKLPILSDEDVSMLGTGLLNCLPSKNILRPAKHFDMTRNEEFLAKHVSPDFVATVEKKATANNAKYRIMSVAYHQRRGPTHAFVYFSVLERENGKVSVEQEYVRTSDNKVSRQNAEPCQPGNWTAPVSAYMMEPEPEPVATSSNAEPEDDGASFPIRSDLVGSWICSGSGKAENASGMQKWILEQTLELLETGEFSETSTIIHGVDTVIFRAVGSWHADEETVTTKARVRNFDKLIINNEEIPPLLANLAGAVGGLLGDAKSVEYKVEEKGWFSSRFVLEKIGTLNADCELQ